MVRLDHRLRPKVSTLLGEGRSGIKRQDPREIKDLGSALSRQENL